MHLIAVIGSKRSGKTTAVEALVKGLTSNGYRVATVKHVSEKDFTMDTKGKDTWRHAKAGATITATVASHELAILRKTDTTDYKIGNITKTFQNEADIIILEGFRKLVGNDKSISKIAAVKNAEEALEAFKQFKPLIVFVGSFSTENLGLPIPYVDVLANPEKLASIILEKMKAK